MVYAFTPKADVAVEVSTCGSLFDTRLYVFDDPANPQVGGAGCDGGRLTAELALHNGRCSRHLLEATLQ